MAATVQSFDGTSIAYDLYDHTSRSLVLVIPGFWRDRRHPSMLALASHLTDLGYRTAITDPRGHGDSGGTYGFNLYEHYDTAAVAEELLRRLPIESITIVALSYGASVAISTAARHKLPIASLLLISAVADFGKITPRINPFTLHRHIALSQALKRPRNRALSSSRPLSDASPSPAQIGDRSAIVIEDGGFSGEQFDAGLENRRRLLLSVQRQHRQTAKDAQKTQRHRHTASGQYRSSGFLMGANFSSTLT